MIHVERHQSRVEQLRIADCGLRIENPKSEIQNPKSLRSLTSPPRLPPSAFTLVELLISILIISILAAALLGVAAVAGETAREAKTRNIIARIHTLLMEQYDSYKSRRVKVRQQVTAGIDDPTISLTPFVRGIDHQQARLYALREMMMMEMPCRWSDVLLNAVPASPQGYNDALFPVYLDPLGGASAGGPGAASYRTTLAALYLRQYNQIANATNKLTGVKNTQSDILANEGAECLYMVVMNATGDGEAKTLFPESGIGDTDGDGAPEFLDGWGHPISFLRWAPGFTSDIQQNAIDLQGDPPTSPNTNLPWENAAKADHDPFDLFRIELAAFRLTPLIISSGRDESFGIRMNTDTVWQGNNSANFPFSPTATPRILTPYVTVHDPKDNATVYLGADDGSKTATDNIHNHLIGTR
jgi:prepilin-type N-terminal cleavage/methylation domain-containing protein